MTTTTTPTLDDLKAWLGIEDDEDDLVLSESLDAAVEAQCRVCCLPRDGFGDLAYTPDLRTALFLRAQRLTARRNSPEGVLGLQGVGGDFVSARVASWDNDVVALEGPYRTIPVA